MVSVSTLGTSVRASAWLANAPLDLAMGFGWLPFYLWLLTTPVAGNVTDAAFLPAFRLAVVVVLSLTFVHRHLVYFLFFGDAQQRARHPQALWVAPLLITALVVPGRQWHPQGFDVVVIALVGWNIWHTLSQRHGIARAYAAKGGGGLDAPVHGRRDWLTLWALAAWTAAAVIVFRQDTFYGRAQRLLATIHVVQDHPATGWVILVTTTGIAVALAITWVRAEAQARPRGGRAPRLLFWASSLCLFGIFVRHGPLVGYLVFGFAHALEYILFVYLFSHRKLARGEAAAGVRALGGALSMATVSASLLVLFVAAHQVWTVPLFATYYAVTSALHFFYDGVIWKMRRPEVRAPIVA